MIYFGVFYLLEVDLFPVEDLTKQGLNDEHLVGGGTFFVGMVYIS